MFENVYGITGAEGGAAWLRIQEAFSSAGYKLYHRVLDSADYGVPQHRERMIIVGVQEGEFRFPRPTHGPESLGDLPFFTASEAIADVSNGEGDLGPPINGKYGALLAEIPPGLNYSFFTEKMGHPRPIFAWRSKFSDFLYKADPDWPVRTIKAFCGQYTGPFHWENRRFTVSELKRLQTFPDAYAIAGSRGVVLQQIGNSVPPQMARVLALAVLDQVFGVRLPVAQPLLEDHDRLGFRTRKRAVASEYGRRAAEAVRGLSYPAPTQVPVESRFGCDIGDDFRLVRAAGPAPVTVGFSVAADRLDIEVRHGRKTRAAYVIDVAPFAGRTWAIPLRSVRITGNALDRKCFLVGWKAFEVWMHERHLKEDMVQLCGYYAYEPAIQCKMSIGTGFTVTDDIWPILCSVVAGCGVRSVQSAAQLAKSLAVPVGGIRGVLGQLKHMGYEVRSHKTNPQLQANTFLVPYSFPTFTNKSVQLHKALF